MVPGCTISGGSNVIPIIGAVDTVDRSWLTGGEVTTRVIWVGRMVSSKGTYEGRLLCPLGSTSEHARVWVGVCVTRLKGDLTEHHPHVSEVKVAAQGFGCPPVQWHGDVAGTRVPVVQHCLEWHRVGVPASNGAWLKPTGDGGEDLHTAGEHVVTVNLNGGTKKGFSYCLP